jgi:hypothetical protein
MVKSQAERGRFTITSENGVGMTFHAAGAAQKGSAPFRLSGGYTFP